MAATPNDFLLAKEAVLDNLETLQGRASACEDQGMLDPDSSVYNEILLLIDDAEVTESFDELEEVITRGKEMERNIDTWLSIHGSSTMELNWPKVT